jgi:hypothetical protein
VAPWRDGLLESERGEAATGAIFSLALFWIVLACGLVLAIFVFVQPFLAL